MTGTLYAARTCGNKYQTAFPDRCVIDFNEPDENVRRDQVEAAVKYDHDPANFGDKGRSNKNFLCADMCTIDIDNADPDPAKWATIDDIVQAFTTDEGEGPAGFITRSRHYMQPAHGNVAERYHVYLLIDMTIDGPHLTALRLGCNQVLDVFTVDPDAIDPSRMTYGTEEPCVVFLPGRLTLDEFMRKKGIDVDALASDGSGKKRAGSVQFNVQDRTAEGRIVYHEGTRNASVCRDFSRYLKRRGTADPAATQQAFEEIAGRCDPPLDNAELNDIYNSCLRLYENDIKNRADYTSPEEYDQKMAEKDFSQDQQGPTDADAPDQTQEEKIQALGDLLVADRSDIGQGEALAVLYHDRILNFEGDWLYYTGTVWESNKARVRALEHEHTKRQLNAANKKYLAATKERLNAEKGSPEEAAAQKKIDAAERDRKWVMGRRKASAVDAALKSAAVSVQVKAEELDADPELLNTPAGIVDLRSGILTPSDPAARCTKITGVAPGDQGADIWAGFLDQITDGDSDLIKYLQQISGMFLIGRVMLEKLIVAYGPGGNGKSSLFDTLLAVMGDYAGGLAAEVLTTAGRQNAKAEMAELRGRRLVVCAELSDGCRLNSSMLKQLCSVDPVRAEKKYQDPFSFTPTHSVVLYTNYLPKITNRDSGTWSRIAIVPFQHTFRGKPGEILNYSNYLTENAGPAVLSWMIDGSVEFLKCGGILSTPAAVEAAVNQYKSDNDTVQSFIDNACLIGENYCKQSSELYVCYRRYCDSVGTPAKSQVDFSVEMKEKGFKTRKTKQHNDFLGITNKG